LDIDANQLVYDPARQQLYASVGSADASYPNTVAIIDPSALKVTSTIAVGKDPHRLALSQDGAYLYVGADGSNAVQRINLGSKTVEAMIDLGVGGSFSSPLVAGDIQVMPGSPKTFAIARNAPFVSPSAVDVAIYDDTTMRPNTSAASRQTIDYVAFGDSGSTLYGMDSEISDFAFVRMTVDANGVTVQDSTYALLGWGYFAQMTYSAGLIYSTSGGVANPATLTRLGTFPTGAAESILVDGGVPYTISHDQKKGPIITAYDPQHYLPTATGNVLGVPGVAEQSLIKAGNSFAFVEFKGGTLGTSVIISTAALTPIAATTPTTANLLANHILWDPGTERLYTSIPSAAGSFGNSVAIVNPATQSVESTIYVGSEPDALAVSNDSQYLYVGLDGAGAVARMNLGSHAVEAVYSLGNQVREGPIRAFQIAVVPDAPHSYVISLQYLSNPSPNYAGLAAYDDGVQRTNMILGFSSSDALAFSDSPAVMYGINNQVDANVRTMKIDASGISITNVITDPLNGFARYLQYNSGTLYGSTGVALIPATPALGGVFNVGPTRGMAIDGAGGSAYFLSDNSTTQKATLLQYDLNKFVLKAYQDLPIASGAGTEMAPCGANGFAILAHPGVIFATGSFTEMPPLGSNANGLAVNRLVWNPTKNQIIASVPGYVGPGGNSIALINPVSQTITSSFFVGSEPNSMALSADDSALYVGLDGSGSVAEVDLASGTVTHSDSLGFDSNFGPLFAHYLSVKPGDPNVVAVSRRRHWGVSPLANGVVILDNGTQLPNISNSPFDVIDSIAFGDSGTDLYGFDNETTGFEFYRMKVDSSGVSMTDKYNRLFYGFFADIQDHNGLIYSTNGTVVNGAVPSPQGMFPISNPSTLVSTFLDDATKQASFLQLDFTQSPPTAILRYNLNNYSFIDSTPVSGVFDRGHDLIRFSASGAAFVAPSGLKFTTVSTATPPSVDLAHLTARHLLNDPLRNRIYATVPGSVAGIGNSVAIIDPTASTIASTIPVGSEPDVMAMSPDGLYLYVGLDGSGSITRINLATNSADFTFSLGTDVLNGAYLPGSISVSPADSTTIAVARSFANLIPAEAGVAIYKNGTLLSNTTAPGADSASTIAFCSSGSALYGYDSESSLFPFYTMSVDSNGVQQTGSVDGLIQGVANIACDQNLIYSTSGYVVDPTTNSPSGVFPGLIGAAGMAVDDANQEVFFLMTDSHTNAVSILGFNQTSYSQTGTLAVTNAKSAGRDLVRWGTSGFAVATQNQVLLISGKLP
jgi:YVTN family beta-propeller protein